MFIEKDTHKQSELLYIVYLWIADLETSHSSLHVLWIERWQSKFRIDFCIVCFYLIMASTLNFLYVCILYYLYTCASFWNKKKSIFNVRVVCVFVIEQKYKISTIEEHHPANNKIYSKFVNKSYHSSAIMKANSI